MPWWWVATKYSIQRVQHTLCTAYTEYSKNQVQHTPSSAYTKYSINQVQLTLSTASTQDCLYSLHSHDCKLTSEFSFRFRRASLYDRPPLASFPWEHECNVNLLRCHGCELRYWWIDSLHPVRRPFQVLVQFRSITASKCISKLAQSQPPSASRNLLNHSLQLYLQTSSIMAYKCISKLAQSRHASVSPDLLDNGLQVGTIMASKCISKLSLDYGLQVHLQTRSLMANKCISTLIQLQSTRWYDHGLQVHLQTLAWLQPPSAYL